MALKLLKTEGRCVCFLSADVQRWPHGAALLLEESDRHQRDDAVAAKQTLLLGAQRQVGSVARLHFFCVSILKGFGFVPRFASLSAPTNQEHSPLVIFCFSGIKLFRNVLQRPETQLWPAALCCIPFLNFHKCISLKFHMWIEELCMISLAAGWSTSVDMDVRPWGRCRTRRPRASSWRRCPG